MPRRAVEICAGNYYHLYNRGVNRGLIFFRPENYLYFLQRLRHHLPRPSAEIVAYCLMPNHYHLLLRSEVDEITSRMHDFAVSFSKGINRQQRRVGPLFQGRFQAKSVATDEYVLHLSRYIHFNPVAAGPTARADEWPYSGYIEFVGPTARFLVDPDLILDQLAPSKATPVEMGEAYRQFVEESHEDVELFGNALFRESASSGALKAPEL